MMNQSDLSLTTTVQNYLGNFIMLYNRVCNAKSPISLFSMCIYMKQRTFDLPEYVSALYTNLTNIQARQKTSAKCKQTQRSNDFLYQCPMPNADRCQSKSWQWPEIPLNSDQYWSITLFLLSSSQIPRGLVTPKVLFCNHKHISILNMFQLADIIINNNGTTPADQQDTALGIYNNILYNLADFHFMAHYHRDNRPKEQTTSEFYAHNWGNLTIYDRLVSNLIFAPNSRFSWKWEYLYYTSSVSQSVGQSVSQSHSTLDTRHSTLGGIGGVWVPTTNW